MSRQLTNTSKFLSLVLRHKPEEIGLVLDINGWANIDELMIKTNVYGIQINLEFLKEIVSTNEKKRFSFNDDFTKIRANQGHSVEVDVELKEMFPPAMLYHGTATRFLSEIMQSGLNKMNRLHVHLTDNYSTALKTGERHGKAIVLEVDAKAMSERGIKFFISENKVWLVDHVPVQYLKSASEL